MREMTTAEFAKANLAALEEPVKIRRYTKAVGTYYPEGYIAALEPPAPVLGPEEIAPSSTKAAAKIIEDLTEEVKHLKKQLAAQKVEMPKDPFGVPTAADLVPRPTHPMKDVFSDLAKQDREFFERKLGKPGKTTKSK